MAEPLRPESPPTSLPVVEGGFKTILADPPWRFANRTGKVAPEHRRLDRYSTMDLEAIKALPVAQIAARDAHLYLWVPNALLPDGLAVMQAWGFRYVSNVIWAKRRKDGGPDGRGVGFYFRNVTEPILFGVRGSMRTLPPARSMVNMIETRKREHSRKPDEQYAMIEAASPGPYLEMFARHAQPGWTVWGDEASEEITPRGAPQRGYAGGQLDLPWIEPHQRLDHDKADAIATILAAEYEAGDAIRTIAERHGYPHARVARLLKTHGVSLRPRGRPTSTPATKKASSAPTTTKAAS